MTTLSRELADRADRYQSLSNFYRADGRRRSSREQDVGLWWRVGANGPVYRAAWIRETGELYVTRLGRLEDGGGEVFVLGRARDRTQLDEVMEGWQDVCPQPDSMTWLRHRAASLAPPEKPAPSSAHPSLSHARRREGGRAPRPRRPDAPGPAERPARGASVTPPGCPHPRPLQPESELTKTPRHAARL
jgi:hypothetical protein